MHVVGFDATGESIELRITARDRSAYVAGALLASDWLQSGGEQPTGIVRFDHCCKAGARCARRFHPPTGIAPKPAFPPRRSPMVTAERQLRGAFTALVTPFTSDGAVDERRFREFVAWQVLAGIDGVVPCGTTGESPTLSHGEKDGLIDWTVEVVRSSRRDAISRHRGHGTNDTAATIAATRRAPAVGAAPRSSSRRTTTSPTSGCSRPHYRRSPTRAICRLSVTTLPSRTGVNVEAATMLRLAELRG